MKTPLSTKALTESDCWAHSRVLGTIIGLCIKCVPGCVSLQNRHWEIFEGKHFCLLQNWTIMGTGQAVQTPFHYPTSIFDALYPAYTCHFPAHFSSCCPLYGFTDKEHSLSQFLWCEGKGRQRMLLGLQLHELREWVKSGICFFTQCKNYRNPVPAPGIVWFPENWDEFGWDLGIFIFQRSSSHATLGAAVQISKVSLIITEEYFSLGNVEQAGLIPLFPNWS